MAIVTERIPLSSARNIRYKLPPPIQVHPALTVYASWRTKGRVRGIYCLQEFPQRHWSLGIPTQCQILWMCILELTFGHSHSLRRCRICSWRLHNLLLMQGWHAGSGRARGSICLYSQTALCRRTRTDISHISAGTLNVNNFKLKRILWMCPPHYSTCPQTCHIWMKILTFEILLIISCTLSTWKWPKQRDLSSVQLNLTKFKTTYCEKFSLCV